MPNSDPELDSTTALNTKMLMFRSRPLLEEVVTKLRLDQDSRFLDSSQKRTRWETVKSFVSGSPAERAQVVRDDLTLSQSAPRTDERIDKPQDALGLPVADPKLDRSVAILQTGLAVEKIKDTQALKISFTHRYPGIAALVANGLTERFIHRNFESKIDRYTTTSSWLETSTEKMKAKVREAEQALANYTRDHNIFNKQGPSTLTNDRVAKLSDQAMRAELDVYFKQSLYEEVKQGRVAKLPEAFGDPRIGELQKKLNDLSITAAQLNVTYGPEHENVKSVKQQMLVIQEQLQESRTNLEEKLKSEYARAVRDNETLKTALEQAKTEAVKQDQAGIQYSILKQDVDTANALYTEFLHKTNQANLEVAQQRNNMTVIQPAQVPRVPDTPPPVLPITAALLGSLALGVGVAFLVERLDTTIKNVGDVNRYAQLPTLGVIPAMGVSRRRLIPSRRKGRAEPISVTNGSKATLPPAGGNGSKNGEGDFEPSQITFLGGMASGAEAYRALRTSVLLSAAGKPPKIILFTSGRPAEGKTTTVVNTAISLAQLGSSVLIIDADLRKSANHKGFNVDSELGLSTYLSRDVKIEGLIQKLNISNLSLLACGPIPPNPAELISSEKMKGLLKLASERYDHVIIDSPPLMYVTDSVILSTLVDGVILVVHAGKSTRQVVRQSRHMLALVGAKVYGVVLNNVSLRHLSSGALNYYYPYQSTEGVEREQDRVSDLLS
jgi:capsular exopolysaccharide synthesis family protein